jgi:hypothetical protein
VKPLLPGESQGTSPGWTAGKLGGGLILDGLQYGEIAHNASIDLTRTVTMEAWIKVDRFGATWTPVLHKGTGAGNERTYSLWLNSNGSLLLSTGNGVDQGAQSAAGLIALDRWQHVAATIDRNAGVAKIYIDGVERGSSAIGTASSRSTTNPLLIGRTSEAGGYAGFEGTIDDVRIWSVVRSAADIAASRDAELTGAEAGLAAYLKANEATGDRLVDASALGNDALIRGLYGPGTVAGRIDVSGQRDLYTFTLDAGRQLYFDSLTNNASLSWSLRGPRGTVVSNKAFSATDSFEFGLGNPVLDLVAGDYTLTIDAAGDATIGYAFRLLDLAQAPVITPGTPVTGQLNPSRATDLYRFSADAGARFFFDFRNVSAPAGSEVYWRLVDPYGNVVFDRTAFTADVGLRTLERAGMYTLIVEGRVTNSQLPTPAIGYSFNAQLIADESKTLVLGESQGTAPKWTAGQLGGAAYLDGLQYGEVAHDAAIDLTQNATLELWFKADRLSQTWTPLLSKGNASGSDTYSLWLNSGGYVHV